MLDALWSAEFSSAQGGRGRGVAVLRDGKVHGGDDGYTYVGTYKIDASSKRIEARLQIKRYDSGSTSVFGGIPEFALQLNGPASDRGPVTLTGDVVGQPGLAIKIVLTRRAEL